MKAISSIYQSDYEQIIRLHVNVACFKHILYHDSTVGLVYIS